MDSDPTTRRAQSRVGQVLRAKWHLDRLIGVGGMAAVYAATHRNRMRGAVKMLHPELGSDDEARSRFLREGYVANNVDHPGVVRVLDDDLTEDGAVFVVMELLEGQTVDALAESRPGNRLEVGEVLAIADELLDVLALAHERGVVHRDLKPENLFLTTSGQIKVLDFGIARLRDMSTMSNATSTGIAMGTPAFMPPEQALGNWDQVDGRTDLWAVGATMYALLTGRFVHHADTVQKLMLAAMTKPAPPLAITAPHLPPHVCAIVDCALAFETGDRWSSARAMQSAVREARTGAPHAFVPPPTPAKATIVSGALPADASVPATSAAQPPFASPRSPTPSVTGPRPALPGELTEAPVTSSSSGTTRQRRSRGRVVGVALASGLVLVGAGLLFASRSGQVQVTAAAPESAEATNRAPSGEQAGATAAPPPADPPPAGATAAPPSAIASAAVAAVPRRVPAKVGVPPVTARPSAPPPTARPTAKAIDRW